VSGLSHLRKDNTGYDIRGLLVGSEGTLGIITAASLSLFARPGGDGYGWVGRGGPIAALELLGRLRDALGETVSAFEIMHRQGLAFLGETMPEVPLPLRAFRSGACWSRWGARRASASVSRRCWRRRSSGIW
jgi:FAD/FMN-containing dehydrogenase